MNEENFVILMEFCKNIEVRLHMERKPYFFGFWMREKQNNATTMKHFKWTNSCVALCDRGGWTTAFVGELTFLYLHKPNPDLIFADSKNFLCENRGNSRHFFGLITGA